MEHDERHPPYPGDELTDDARGHVREATPILRGQPRSEGPDASGQESGGSGWVTTDVAARSMRVSPRTVRRMIERGELEAKLEGEGVERRWLVSVDSLYALRSSRTVSESPSAGDRAHDDRADSTGGIRPGGREDPGTVADIVADMIARLEARTEEAVELRVRLELTERAQSSVEAERDRLLERVGELEAALEQRDVPETASPRSGGGTMPPEHSQEPTEHRSWLYRFFFGP